MTLRSDLELRTARPVDAEVVRDLVRSAYAKWVPIIGREPMPMKVDYAQAIIDHQIDLLHTDGVIVGLIETRCESDHLWIENIAISPDRQGQGLGRRLLDHAERLAKAAELNEIRLLTNEAMVENIALYEKSGYALDRREPFVSGGVTVYMSKMLQADA